MATFSSNLALTLLTTGEGAGTWGNTTNTNLGTLLEQAISGYVTQAVATGTDTTLTIPNGATGVARNMYIELTGTGGASTNLVVPANKKLYFIFNNTTGAVTVKASGQTGVSVAAGNKVILVSNGTDIVEATTYLTTTPASVSITTLTATSATITTLGSTSANITTLGSTSANITTLGSTSANITTLTGTTFGTTATTQLRGASAQITTLTSTSANITTLTGTNFSATSLTLATPLGRAQGGTGLSTAPTNGQLLIGNGSGFALSTLTAGTGMTITNNAGSITLASAGLPTMNIVSGTTQTAVNNNHYVLTNASATTVTLPTSPSAGNVVWITVANGRTDNVVARNGQNINSIAENMTIDSAYAGIQLRFADATRGWVFT